MKEYTDAEKAAWILEHGEPDIMAIWLQHIQTSARAHKDDDLNMSFRPWKTVPVPPWLRSKDILDEIQRRHDSA